MEIQIPHGLKLFSRTGVFLGCKYRRFYFFLSDAPASLSVPAPADSYRDDGDCFTCEWFDQTQRSLDLRGRLAPGTQILRSKLRKVAEHRQACRSRAPFHRHYVQAPTCGASRYTLLTGKYGPSHNGALFARSNHVQSPSFPAWFRKKDTSPCQSAKYRITPEEEEGRTGMRMTNPKCPNPGTDISCPPDLGNTRVAPCTVWPMEKFARMPRTWTSIRPLTDRTGPIPTDLSPTRPYANWTI